MYKCALVCLILISSINVSAHAEETDHYAVASEYIRELSATEDLRALAEKELSQAKDVPAKMAGAIRNSTRLKLELGTNIEMLRSMQLNKPLETLLPSIIYIYEKKIELHDEMMKIAGTFMSGSKPGVDYGAYAARMPEITANLEFLDETLFETTPLIFSMLIDPKPDKDNHMSRLLITKSQCKKLADTLTKSFGKKLNQAEQNYTVSSASVLHTYITEKGYKCADEP